MHQCWDYWAGCECHEPQDDLLPIMRDCDGCDIVHVTLKGTRDSLASFSIPVQTIFLYEPDTTHFPSCENATENMLAMWPPERLETVQPVSTSQTWIMLLSELEMTQFPSCKIGMEMMLFVSHPFSFHLPTSLV